MQFLEKVLVKLGHGLGLPSRYKLLKKIGAGAEGEVWLGVDAESQSMVALKLIPRGAPAWKLDMARREFSMLAQLGPGHLNIVRPIEVVLTTKHLMLITEYVPGGSLSDHLARHSVCEEVAVYFFKQLLDAVTFCHSRKIVYRDIKPANILITGTQPPFVKLCDFGLADCWEGRPGPNFKSLVGTPGYMAPEIMSSFFTGAAELARRSREAALARRSQAAASTAAANAASTAKKQKKQKQQQPEAEAGMAAAAANGVLRTPSNTSAAAAGSESKLKKAASGLKRSASGALADMAAAAAPGAATVPGGSGLSRSLAAVAAAVGLKDSDPAAEMPVVGDYDGEKADVYSLGVLLVVIVLRRMPWNYDAYAERLPLLKAMKSLYDTSVVHQVSWRAATPKADTLSPQLASLLDGMLEPDPKKRFTMKQVAASEWLQTPVPPKLQCALEVLSEQQELREVRYTAALAAAAEDGCCPDAAAAAADKMQLEEMIAAARTVGKGYKCEARLLLLLNPLSRSQHNRQQQQLQQLQHTPKQSESQQQQQQQQQQGEDNVSSVSAEECCTAAIISAPLQAVGAAAVTNTAGAGKAGSVTSAVDVTVQVG